MNKKQIDNSFAIVSMGCVFPNGFNVNHYWDTLKKGDTSFMPTPKNLWDSSLYYSSDKRAKDKYYDDVVSYPHQFHLDPKDFSFEMDWDKVTDREKYIYSALNQCKNDIKTNNNRVKVYVGHTNMADFVNDNLYLSDLFKSLESRLNRKLEEVEKNKLSEILAQSSQHEKLSDLLTHNKLSKAVLKVFNQEYPVQLVDAACASSLYTIELGIIDLLNKEIDYAICGGISYSAPLGKVLFCRLGGSSPTGVYPFQERADGTVFGEGAGFIGLKRLGDAIRDQDTIHSIIRGIGTSSDGKGKAIYAPNQSGQILAMERAYKKSKIDPKTIQWIEAHGTGTPAGDFTEFKSISQFLSSQSLDKKICVSSLKGLFGHLGWAAGVASVIKMTLALKNKTLLSQHHFSKANPMIDLESSPLYINRINKNWEVENNSPRRVGINGFGFGGTNAHVILEEYSKDTHYTTNLTANITREPVAIVGIGCQFPSAENWNEVSNLFKSKQAIKKSFEESYRPNNIKYRIIDRSASVIDDSQIMLLDTTEQALSKSLEKIADLRANTGVFVAQTTCLKKNINHLSRISISAIKTKFVDRHDSSIKTDLKEAIAAEYKFIENSYPAPNEDANPGIMPNVMAGRISNFFNLHGPNLSINSGYASFSDTLIVALKNIYHGRCNAAIVATASRNKGEAFDRLWKDWTNNSAENLTEGSISLFLVKKSEVEKLNLTPLAWLNYDHTEHAEHTINDSGTSQLGTLLSAPDSINILRSIHDSAINANNTSEVTIPYSKQYGRKLSFSCHDSIEDTETIDIKTENLPFLNNHLVNNKPTLPGTFMIEYAAQIAKKHHPDFQIRSIENIQFLKFIRPPVCLKVKTKYLGETDSTVRLKIQLLSDKFSRKGIILQKNIEHFNCEFNLEKQMNSSEEISFDQNVEFGDHLFDPYHHPSSPVYLDGCFVTIPEMKTNNEYNYGEVKLDKHLFHTSFSNHVLPPLVFDGAIRLASIINKNSSPIFVPSSIDKITVHSEQNEEYLVNNSSTYCYYSKKEGKTSLVSNGRVIFEISGMQGTDTGKKVTQEKNTNEKIKNSETSSIKKILVTGATGFLGTHLIGEILKNTNNTVYALVRGSKHKTAELRLKSCLSKYFTWQDSWSSRIVVVHGDIIQDNLGIALDQYEKLTTEIDHIYHCAAKISWSATYNELKKVNVDGTQKIIDFARLNDREIPITFISTIGVFYSQKTNSSDKYSETDDPNLIDSPSGYSQTKIESENLLLKIHEKGHPITIIRPGVLCGPLEQGYWNKDYFLYRMLQYFANSKNGFRSYNELDMTPVDYACKATIYLSENPQKDLCCFHVQNPTPRSFSEIIDMMNSLGWKVEKINSLEWEQKVLAEEFDSLHPMTPVKLMFNPPGSNSPFHLFLKNPKLLSFQTEAILKKANIICDDLDESFLFSYLNWMAKMGEIPQAKTEAEAIDQSKNDHDYLNISSLEKDLNSRSNPKTRLPDLALDEIQRFVTRYMSCKENMLPKLVQKKTHSTLVTNIPMEQSASISVNYADIISLSDFIENDQYLELKGTKSIDVILNLAITGLDFQSIGSALRDLHKFSQLISTSEISELCIHIGGMDISKPCSPAIGSARGLFRALRHDIPHVKTQIIFSNKSFKTDRENILSELQFYDDKPEIYLKDNTAYTLELVKDSDFEKLPTIQYPEKPNIIFTGGGKGIGGFISSELSKLFPECRLAILARAENKSVSHLIEPVIDRYGTFNKSNFIKYKMNENSTLSVPEIVAQFNHIEAQNELNLNLKRIEEKGVELTYYSCDVTSQSDVSRCIEDFTQKNGAIDIVLHCAGVDTSKRISAKPWREFKNNYDVKIEGFLNLYNSINVDEVKCWINFGSYVSILGNEGQSDYCSANETLNSICDWIQDSHKNTKFCTINWPAWDNIGMAARHSHLRDRLKNRGWNFITPEFGSICLFYELVHGTHPESNVYYLDKEDFIKMKSLVRSFGAA